MTLLPSIHPFCAKWRSTVLALGAVLACEASSPGLSPPNVLADAPLEPRDYTIKSWQTEHGLPQMTPTAIAQARDGYLWVGTFNGLSRFDGVRFTSYTINNAPELASDSITVLHVDRKGMLWIGTGEGGLVRYQDGRFHALATKGEFSRMTVQAVCEDLEGNLWVATSRGLLQISMGHQISSVLLPRENVLGVAIGHGGEIWACTSRLIYRIVAKQLVDPSFDLEQEIHALAVDARGYPWVSFAPGGMGYVRPGDSAFSKAPWRMKVVSMHLDETGTLWAGTLSGAIWQLDSSRTNLYRREAQLSGRIAAIHADGSGNIWAGAEAGGLWRMRKSSFGRLGTQDGLLTGSITSMLQNRRGRIWAGTFGKGLHWWDGQKFNPIRMPIAPNVTSVLEDKKGQFWFGTYSGQLGRLEEHTEGVSLHFEETVGQNCRTLFEDSRGALWIGTMGNGVQRFTDGKQTTFRVPEGLSSDHVRALAEDADGDVWVGTSQGLNRIRNGLIEQYHRVDGLGGEQVRVLFRDSEGTLWIGSTGGGLTRWKDGKLQAIGVKEGLVNDWIEQIIEDNHGYLWLGSNDGLMRVNLRELNDCISGRTQFVHCTVFRREAGLPLPHCGTGFQPSSLKTPDGKLWFGTGAGIVIIDPATIRSSDRTPPVYIEEMLVDQEVMSVHPIRDSKRLKAGTQRLEFRYTGLDSTAPALVRFRHKLEGYDADWVNAGMRREAVYTRVPPGEYRFRVLAANNEGNWNGEGASLVFAIQPFFWQTRAFQVATPGLALLLSGFAAWGFFARKHKRELEMLERKHALERERARIAQDMHDGLGSSLVKISLLGEQAESRFAEEDHAQPQIRKMTATARQVIREMDEIVWAVNPRNDTLENFAGYLCGFATEHFGDTTMECRLDIPAEFPAQAVRAEVRHNLFLAVREALNNVLKHSEARHVWVRMDFVGGQLVIEIQDDGKGFPTGTRRRGNGLENMRQRLELLGGQMELEAGPSGTKVRFSISVE